MPDAAIMKIMINYGIYGAAVCVFSSVLLVVEGKGLKFPLNLFIANPSPNVSPARSLYFYLLSRKKK
jgi:hypothetical protein